MIGHAVWFDALDSDYCGNGEVLNPDWGPILVPWNREPLEHKMCRCGETVMTYHQVLVSKELGGADLIALRIADELQKRAHLIRAWVLGDGAAANEAHRLGIDVRKYDEVLLSRDRSQWETTVGNLSERASSSNIQVA